MHLDGARLPNALVTTGASPADMSWKAGVDILTFGLTKNGALGCEIIIFFGKARRKSDELQARAKRSGHMPPKMRFLAAQAIALLQDGLWMELAAHANAIAKRLGAGLEEKGVTLAFPVEGNEVFAQLSEQQVSDLREAGVVFHPWPDGSMRFVCSWATLGEDVTGLVSVLK